MKTGTIDWEVMFENAETGLIPLISGAGSARALRDSALAVVKLLYTRKDDSPELERLTAELQGLIPNDTPENALPRIVEGVTAILRQIKDDRIHKAEELARHKELIKDDDKRDAVKHAKNAAGNKAFGDRAKGNKWQVNLRIASGAAAEAAVASLCLIVYFAVSGGPEEKFAVPRKLE